MKIKGLIDKFHAWQKEPYRYPDKVEDVHQCANCGYEFTGNYCPVCGQKQMAVVSPGVGRGKAS